MPSPLPVRNLLIDRAFQWMAHYYFDVRDGTDVAGDEIGLELPDVHAAMTEAKRAVADIAFEALRFHDDTGNLAVVVRNGANEIGSVEMSYQTRVVPLPLH